MIMEIVAGVYLLSSFLGIGAWGANVYLLVDGGDLTLVDTGLPGRADQIVAQIEELGYSPSDVKRIIITHHHADHMGSLAELKRITQAEVIAHPADAPYIDGTLSQPGPARPIWLSKFSACFSWLWATEPVVVDKLVNDGDELPILGGIKILHTPGHTPGSICLYLKSQKLLIAGDLLARRFSLKLPSRMFTVDIDQEIQSVKRVAGMDFDIICFGHGSPIRQQAHQAVADFADTLTLSPRSAE
jgi:glyoxylase-like metal-dependent hydrolase (beta-lactamase superfamily II)